MWDEPRIFLPGLCLSHRAFSLSPCLQVHSVIIVYAILCRRPPCGNNILHTALSIVYSKVTAFLKHRLPHSSTKPSPQLPILLYLNEFNLFFKYLIKYRFKYPFCQSYLLIRIIEVLTFIKIIGKVKFKSLLYFFIYIFVPFLLCPAFYGTIF